MSRQTVSSKTLKMVQLALFSAIIIIMSFVPYTGVISYGIISITTVHIPTIIGSIMLGTGGGAFLGALMGVCMLIRAWIMPGSPLEQIIFMNPLVSVLPRIIIGIVAALVFKGIMKLSHDKASLSSGVAALAGTLTNTVLVLTMMYSLYPDQLESTFGKTIGIIISTIFGLNGGIEIIAAIVVTIPIVNALRRVNKKFR